MNIAKSRGNDVLHSPLLHSHTKKYLEYAPIPRGFSQESNCHGNANFHALFYSTTATTDTYFCLETKNCNEIYLICARCDKQSLLLMMVELTFSILSKRNSICLYGKNIASIVEEYS